ncbi:MULTISPECIES: TolC family protein [unclassified Neisseria]|uniref:TolC family protein n=1 Tax=unclassified Neisseria TaxID=2623750 RepID=UPI0026650DB9|nr:MULTISPECIES: TolC family protein [unclassified Neisseria]MDO1510533.1 TolC family protein [Neisseria sp. MVDL19-042950]MDO1516326.1 TolC family protein [Neisseria sp. MVDL18-041461]MDO1564128.1 TolC family protein [Neisseria sp. MVDL20-010259]
MQNLTPTSPIKGWLKYSVASLILFFSVQPAYAQELKDILRRALVSDPILQEAKANENAAKSITKATRARHYPVLALTGTQVLKQKNKYTSSNRDNGLGVRGSLNLYSWGAINAAVKREKNKETYHHYKYFETQEQLGSEIGKLYLTALRAKESLAVSQQSLNRHNNLLKDLDIIVKYDAGRRSELVEAQARRLQVETTISQLNRTMELALSRLSKYTASPISAKDLKDPFRNYTASSLIKQYKSNDKGLNPSYLAQQAERESVNADLAVAKAERLPALNLEGSATQDNKELYLNLSWNVLDMAARHNVERNAHALIAADAKSEQILREVTEKARTTEIDMVQSEQRAEITAQHIVAQKEVVKSYELQFKIARRTLTDVLGSYNELAGIEQENINARNDFRDAALEYLVAQSQVASWSGINH